MEKGNIIRIVKSPIWLLLRFQSFPYTNKPQDKTGHKKVLTRDLETIPFLTIPFFFCGLYCARLTVAGDASVDSWFREIHVPRAWRGD